MNTTEETTASEMTEQTPAHSSEKTTDKIPSLSVVVSRRTKKTNPNGYPQSIITTTGRAFIHENGRGGLNIQFSAIPVLQPGSRLLIFAGKGQRFPQAFQRLDAYRVTSYSTNEGTEKNHWSRIGTAFLSSEGGFFEVKLDVIPTDGRVVLFIHEPQQQTAAPQQGKADEPKEAEQSIYVNDEDLPEIPKEFQEDVPF